MRRTSIGRVWVMIFCFAVITALSACSTTGGNLESEPVGEGSAIAEQEQDDPEVVGPETVQNAYAKGYAEGFSAGLNAAASEQDSGEAEGPDQPNGTAPPADSDGFVVVTDVIPDAILEIRYFSTYNFVGERIPGYVQPVALLTAEAADALKAASDAFLQQGYRIKIYDAYRPQTAVDFFKAWAADLDDVRMKDYFYPELAKSALFDLGYVAEKSGHSRGSTVDLTLVDMHTGQEVDMGGPFDFFGELSHFTYTATLTDAQIENRTILHDTMVANGFRALETEWWHFTLVDEPYPDTYFDFPVQDLEALAA